jgi:hypothetical protein
MLSSTCSHADQYGEFPPFRDIAWPPASELPRCSALHVRKRAVMLARNER